jgi:hypothetical protein
MYLKAVGFDHVEEIQVIQVRVQLLVLLKLRFIKHGETS